MFLREVRLWGEDARKLGAVEGGRKSAASHSAFGRAHLLFSMTRQRLRVAYIHYDTVVECMIFTLLAAQLRRLEEG